MEAANALLMIALTAIAARIAFGMFRYRNMYAWFVTYWIVAILKHALDFAGGFVNGF